MFWKESYRDSQTTLDWELPRPKIFESFSFPILKTAPLFIFPNYQDYGYGIFLLDEKSRAYVLENIQNEKDDFLRAMMWGSLWDSVRETELAPRDYVELVIKNIALSSDFSRQSAEQDSTKNKIENADKKPPKGGTQNTSNNLVKYNFVVVLISTKPIFYTLLPE